jgi:hypothetical protein
MQALGNGARLGLVVEQHAPHRFVAAPADDVSFRLGFTDAEGEPEKPAPVCGSADQRVGVGADRPARRLEAHGLASCEGSVLDDVGHPVVPRDDDRGHGILDDDIPGTVGRLARDPLGDSACFDLGRLRQERAGVRDLERLRALVGDDDGDTEVGRLEQMLGERHRQSDAAVRRGVARQIAGVEGDAGPGEALHVRHLRALVDGGDVLSLLLEDREDADWCAMPRATGGARRDADLLAATIDMNELLGERRNDDDGTGRREFRSPDELAGLELRVGDEACGLGRIRHRDECGAGHHVQRATARQGLALTMCRHGLTSCAGGLRREISGPRQKADRLHAAPRPSAVHRRHGVTDVR